MTRYAILSDIHANIDALEAVLRHIFHLKPAIDEVWTLGDLVVYGPQPTRTIQRLEAEGILNRTHPEASRCVQGNNDYAVGHQLKAESTISQLLSNPKIESPVKDDTVRLRRVTIMAIHEWTKQTLLNEDKEIGDPQALEILINLPTETTLPNQKVVLFHASPCETVGMHGNYLRDEADAEEGFLCLEYPLAFFGHTHIPTVFQQTSTDLPFGNIKQISPKPGEPIELDLMDGKKAMVNPGSVGQPRDGNPDASYAIYDTLGTVDFFRIKYSIEQVENDIYTAGDSIKRLIDDEKFPDLYSTNKVPDNLATRFRNADW
jgi:predicted phosphodiesterase